MGFSDLKTLIRDFEQWLNIPFDQAGINLFGLTVRQCLAHIEKKHSPGLLLTHEEIQACQELPVRIQMLPLPIQQYLQQSRTPLSYHGLIEHRPESHQTLLNHTSDPEAFHFILRLNRLDEKISAIHRLQIGIDDVMDLLEADLFFEEEYSVFFDSCTERELFFLLRAGFEEAFVFDAEFSLDQLDENETSWKSWLIAYLKQNPQKMKRIQYEFLK